MRKATVLLLIVLGLSGCAFIQARKVDWEACKADVTCSEKAKAWQAKGEMAGELIATGVATVVPGTAPAINPAKKVGGFIALGLAMLIGGHALTKKKES
jgi:hypothetical protein